MIKWIALFLAFIALSKAADADKVQLAVDAINARLDKRTCTMMVVLTPSGTETICATRP